MPLRCGPAEYDSDRCGGNARWRHRYLHARGDAEDARGARSAPM